jgi:two-component system osmolarity sensor histidine kinase EnvZ
LIAAGRRSARSWSLVRRLTGGVVLIALLSFGAQALVLALWIQPVADDVAAIAAEQALMVQAALRATPAAQRAALAAQLSSGQVTVSPHEPPPTPPAPPEGWHVPQAEQDGHTRELVGPDIQLRFEQRPGETFAAVFRIPVEGQAWWLTREYGGARSAVSGTLVIWLAVLGLATLGALWLSVRLIARPLGRLAEQLQKAQQQGSLRPLPEHDGSSMELQALVHAFNNLAHQVTVAAQARQQLLAGVSHDLRTPLARLRLRAETQCEPVVADALGADLLALERIVNQFLAYVQGDGGATLGVPEPLALTVGDVVRRCAEGGQPVRAQVEPVQLQVPDLAVHRLLSNLVDNAYAYGQAPVQVRLRATPQGGAELVVQDQGSGMSDDEFERAQQPFVRLTRTRHELGHCGLGLAIVAQIVRQLGGQLRALHPAEGGFGIVVALPAAAAPRP